MSFKEQLHDWTDIDLTEYYLGQSLGLIDPAVSFQVEAKHVFWSNHPIGDMLKKILDDMTNAGVLEDREEPDYQYRWNSKFKGTWDNSD